MFRVSLGLILLCGACSSSKSVTPNPLIVARPYDFDQPAGIDKAKPAPLIVLVHGYGANGFVQDALFGFAQLADAKQVYVAHPDGTTDANGSKFWNATDACCDLGHTGVDDVAYLNAVVDDMEANFNIDPKRVFFVGHSNGAFMSHRMACDAAGRVAGIVALAGDVWKDPSLCKPTAPVAVLQVHGDADTIVPYAGSALEPSATASVATWAQKNGCSGDLTDTGVTVDLDSSVTGSETAEAKYTCASGAAELWTIRGGQHVPSFRLPDWGNDVFDWLMAHPKP
jgi:polyhydroxybutyrate depolymerase